MIVSVVNTRAHRSANYIAALTKAWKEKIGDVLTNDNHESANAMAKLTPIVVDFVKSLSEKPRRAEVEFAHRMASLFHIDSADAQKTTNKISRATREPPSQRSEENDGLQLFYHQNTQSGLVFSDDRQPQTLRPTAKPKVSFVSEKTAAISRSEKPMRSGTRLMLLCGKWPAS